MSDRAGWKKWQLRLTRLGVQSTLVPVETVAERVRELNRQGYTFDSIASVVGFSRRCISDVARERHRGVDVLVARRLMLVSHADLIAASGRYLPKIGTERRYHALQALGWRAEDIGEAVSAQAGRASNRRVTRGTYDAMCEAYDRLSMTPGPDDRLRRWALKRGWSTPLAWDDDEIDDPAAKPRNGPNRRDVNQERVDEIWRLTRASVSERVIAERLGISARTVGRIKAKTREVAA